MSSNIIGKKLKEFREFRHISREDLTLKSNLNAGQIEKIEEEGVMPSLGHLIKISRALGVRIGTFLDDQTEPGPVITRADEKKSGMSFSTKDESTREHLNFFSLAQDKF